MAELVLWFCQRCWGEDHAKARPRCRHCGRTMVNKNDPHDQITVLDLIVDELQNQPGE